MSRNRKYQSAVIRFGPALKAVVLCVLIGGSGVGYVWQKDQISRLGQQIKRREQQLKKVSDQNENLRQQLALMRLRPYLERRIQELNLGLSAPQVSQVVTVPEPRPGENRSLGQSGANPGFLAGK